MSLASAVLILARERSLTSLHSFPTRRSSDLGQHRRGLPRQDGCQPQLHGVDGPGAVGHPAVRHSRGAQLEAVRSEEHTSELQSPYDLVCRLLLEKKKNKMYIHILMYIFTYDV